MASARHLAVAMVEILTSVSLLNGAAPALAPLAYSR